MTQKKLYWNKEETPQELISLLQSLEEEFPISESAHQDAACLEFRKSEKSGELLVSDKGDSKLITYHSTSQAARGIGCALGDLTEQSQTTFSSFGIMLDCSRNAVMKTSYLKSWMRRLSLMGYNMIMLYTEDTYCLPDEPFFGFQRGPYSLEEIKDLDEYAKTLGIELIGCIQTLGHMEKTLRWPAYQEIKDTNGVLLVDHEDTYALISKMLDFWSEALTTRRLHVGMDETFGLGQGKFKEKFGEEDPASIYSRHLAKVKDLCLEKDLKPMIWSDMIFDLKGGAADEDKDQTEELDNIKSRVPQHMELVHWDYYHEDKNSYLELLKKHLEIGTRPSWHLEFGHGLAFGTTTSRQLPQRFPALMPLRSSGSENSSLPCGETAAPSVNMILLWLDCCGQQMSPTKAPTPTKSSP